MKSDTVFINAGIGQWYCHGSERLKGSLLHHSFPGDTLIWVDNWPSHDFARDCVYNVKAAAFHEAIKRGYKTIIWGDSSIIAVNRMNEFVDNIRQTGYWIGQSGYRASETSTDGQLNFFGVTRDWADGVYDCATGLFGVCLNHEKPRQFIEQWVDAGRRGGFNGARIHAGQSKDPRFRFGRQDQAAASIILGKLGMPLNIFGDHVRFKWDKPQPHHIFHCEGM